MVGEDRQRPQDAWLEGGVTAGDPELLAGSLLDRLEEISSARVVKAGTVLARAGSLTRHVIVVRDGELELSVRTKEGRRIVALVHPGGVVADVSTLCAVPIPFDAIAVRDSAVIEVDSEPLLALLRSSPDLSLRWMTSLARRLLASQRHALTLLRKDLRAQVATVLLLEQELDETGVPVVRLSQGSIAQLLGASRQSISGVLRTFRERGLVRTSYGSVTLTDPAALAAIAG